MNSLNLVLPVVILNFAGATAFSAEDVLTIRDEVIHLRNAEPREWAEFPATAADTNFLQTFTAKTNRTPFTLQLEQHDVKQAWDVRLNGTKLGRLHRDENPMLVTWSIPTATLVDGENTLSVATTSKSPDDIRLGSIRIYPMPVADFLCQSQVHITVKDGDDVTPCRVTIIDNERLAETGLTSNDAAAVRPGVVYCLGEVDLRLPPGSYTIVAGRGPEFSVDKRSVVLSPGDSKKLEFGINREVITDGFVSCDTHVHTLTHSGHGDASMRERMLTLAGEGIEFPIATDHNKHIDYQDLARELGVRQYFTPVIGNEVTTKIGHFNVFPVASADTPIPDHAADDWDDIFNSIYGTSQVKVAILNHARDVHHNYRPFGPRHFLPLTAQNLDGWNLRANAMEVINSAAQQTDMMTLVHDWMENINAGRDLTPVGCSDSHDVARHFVGQGRTLIRCDDTDVGNIDVDTAVNSFTAGKVVVSCGLFANIRINKSSGPGDTVPKSAKYMVEVEAHGPSWIEAHEIELFVNGRSVQKQIVVKENRRKPGRKQTLVADLPLDDKHDVFVSAVVRGPGGRELFWPIAKPYQPTSEHWNPEFMAVTGAIFIDADGDDKFTCAKKYAEHICAEAKNDIAIVTAKLKQFDSATATHVAAILHSAFPNKFVGDILPAARKSSPHIRQAFESYFEAWQHSERARAEL